jgi:molecular chaperone HtpG
MKFFDAIPLRSGPGEVEGVAYVLPVPASLARKTTHRVYLKRMLLTEEGDELLPGWAFFVKCLVNADGLRPTASRESFYEDATLEKTREALGGCIRGWLVDLARRDPPRLQRLVLLHHLAIKALAVADDEFFRIFMDWLPFETSEGLVTFGEFRKRHDVIRFARSVDQFRQIARVAAAQQLGVVNAGYTHDAELLEKAPGIFPELRVEEVEAAEVAQRFDELSAPEQDAAQAFLDAASEALAPFRCSVALRRFKPPELPALYATSADASFRRSADLSREVADAHWSSLLDGLSPHREEPDAELTFNWESALVRKIAKIADEKLLRLSVQMLYVQSLLLGHHPLRSKEMALLNEGLLGLIEWGAAHER